MQERLAINLFDLDHLESDLYQQFLAGRLSLGRDQVVNPIQDAPDEVGIPFSCELYTAAVICDVLRSECKKLNLPQVRIYLYARGWSRVSPNTLLTIVDEGGCILNPQVFKSAGAVELKPLAAKPLVF